MNKCRDYRRDWPAFLSGELALERREIMASHLRNCPDCRDEVEGLRKISDAAGLVREDLRKAMDSVDWETLPAKIADRVFAAEARAPRPAPARRFRAWFAHMPLKPAYAGLGLGLVVGILGTWIVLQKPAAVGEKAQGYHASPQFLERVEDEMARRDTLDYLEKSQYVLLDFVENTGDTVPRRDALSGERVRELLARKKYINAQLAGGRMAAAKNICDQIDMLFLELSQITRDMTDDELSKIQETIRESRLLLKINLAKKELESEV
jgi:hypothetical protein